VVVKCFKSASWNGGGCVPAGAPTLKLVEIRKSPIYRGGWLQSRCSGTPGFGGYEIVGSVTAREFIAETCKETLWFV